MGLFCLPPKLIDECTAMELVETAEANIKLWKDNQDCDYLLKEFAVKNLKDAAKKILKER